MLPKVIHQIVGPKKNKVVSRCLRSWNELKKDGFKIQIWNDNDILNFVRKEYPFALDSILNARNHAEVADIARYLIIYHFGGHYYDWDIQLLNTSLFLEMTEKNPNGYLLKDSHDRDTLASEAFSAKQGEPYLFRLVQDIVEIYSNGERNKYHTIYYSGPFRMRDTFANVSSTQNVLEIKEVFLYNYSEINEMPEVDYQRPMIHYWLHSWL